MDKAALEEIILNINERTGIRNEILEKDYYVCLILKELSVKQKQLKAYFKGGTALYKILNHMNRFSEDIDLTVKINKNESNNSNKTRLKKSALSYDIKYLELIKEDTIDKKGSIIAFYKYDSLFSINELFKSEKIQIEATSFTISEPTSTYRIEPLIYKYAAAKEKETLRKKYNIMDFDIEIITLERIFIDKIFAAEFYYIRNMYDDTSKHIYDITILMKNKKIKTFLKNKKEVLKIVGYKRQEELLRKGGIDEEKMISNFEYLKPLSNELLKSFNKMQKIYVLDEKSIVTIKEIENTFKELHCIFKEIEEEYDLSGMEMDDLFEEYMQIAEEKAMELEDLMPMYSIMEARSYKWDMSENKIKTVMAVTHTDLGTLKLSDVVKRLLSETD